MSETIFHSSAAVPCDRRTIVQRLKPLVDVTADSTGLLFAGTVTVCARLVRLTVTDKLLPQLPGLEAATRQTSAPVGESSTVPASRAPPLSSSDATRTTQQRRPPFSKNPRTV